MACIQANLIIHFQVVANAAGFYESLATVLRVQTVHQQDLPTGLYTPAQLRHFIAQQPAEL